MRRGFDDRAIAAAAGRLSMRRRTPAQLLEHTAKGGNTLLQQRGLGYYSALGRLSAASSPRPRDGKGRFLGKG